MYFKWKEITTTDTKLPNEPSKDLYDNILTAVYHMNRIRVLLGVPIKVNSWHRSPEVNKAVNGSKTSLHMKGFAVDFVPIGMDLKTAIEKISAAKDIPFNQLLLEYNKWIHIDFSSNKREVKEIK